MLFREYNVEEIGRGHECFHNAVKNGKELAKDYVNDYGCFDDGVIVNMTDTITKLIQITGRFCEHYASDLVWELAKVSAFENFKANGENHWVIPIGIRDYGVDHETFILSRLEDSKGWSGFVNPESVYRKLLAVDIEDVFNKWENGDGYYTRTVRLVDITHSLYKID